MERKQTNGRFSGGTFIVYVWDHVFNKASATINVEAKDGEISVSRKDEKVEEKKLLYGAFVKAGFVSF